MGLALDYDLRWKSKPLFEGLLMEEAGCGKNIGVSSR